MYGLDGLFTSQFECALMFALQQIRPEALLAALTRDRARAALNRLLAFIDTTVDGVVDDLMQPTTSNH